MNLPTTSEGLWGRRQASTREEQLRGREAFRCDEACHSRAKDGPRVRWHQIAGMAEAFVDWPECCGQVMRLLPTDVVDRMRDRIAKRKASGARRHDAYEAEQGEPAADEQEAVGDGAA